MAQRLRYELPRIVVGGFRSRRRRLGTAASSTRIGAVRAIRRRPFSAAIGGRSRGGRDVLDDEARHHRRGVVALPGEGQYRRPVEVGLDVPHRLRPYRVRAPLHVRNVRVAEQGVQGLCHSVKDR